MTNQELRSAIEGTVRQLSVSPLSSLPFEIHDRLKAHLLLLIELEKDRAVGEFKDAGEVLPVLAIRREGEAA